MLLFQEDKKTDGVGVIFLVKVFCCVQIFTDTKAMFISMCVVYALVSVFWSVSVGFYMVKASL